MAEAPFLSYLASSWPHPPRRGFFIRQGRGHAALLRSGRDCVDGRRIATSLDLDQQIANRAGALSRWRHPPPDHCPQGCCRPRRGCWHGGPPPGHTAGLDSRGIALRLT
jgi:hypothetical protein